MYMCVCVCVCRTETLKVRRIGPYLRCCTAEKIQHLIAQIIKQIYK